MVNDLGKLLGIARMAIAAIGALLWVRH